MKIALHGSGLGLRTRDDGGHKEVPHPSIHLSHSLLSLYKNPTQAPPQHSHTDTMGASQSSETSPQETSQTITPSSTQIQFSPSLISQLSSPSTSKPKTETPDDTVRRRLAAESEALRAQENEILSKINAALEKENLDREKGGEGAMSSEILGKDMEAIRGKIERMQGERSRREGQGVTRAKEGVIACYK
jgi:altered-inheritance-of-mitochondria protein 13